MAGRTAGCLGPNTREVLIVKVEEIFIDGYGHLHNVRLSLPDGLVCVYGLNETGKSTILAFIRSVLFGFSKALTQTISRSGTPYDPVEGGEKGGHLIVGFPSDGTDRRYRFVRTRGARADGELTVDDYSGKRTVSGDAAEELKRELLGGADATLFSNVFALGLSELHSLDSIGRPEVQGVLFTADAGLGSGLVSEMGRLKDSMDELYVKRRGSRKIINALNGEIQDVEKHIREARSDLASYEPHRRRREQLSGERVELEEERSSLYTDRELAGQRTRARPVAARLKDVNEGLDLLGNQVLPTNEDASREAELRGSMEADLRETTDRQTRLDDLSKQLANLIFSVRDADLWPRVQAVQPTDLDRLLADARAAQELRRRIADLGTVYVTTAEENRYRKLREEHERLDADHAKLQGILRQADKRREVEERMILPPETEVGARAVQRIDLGILRTADADANGRVKAEEHNLARALAEMGTDWTEERLSKVPTDIVGQANIAIQLPDHIEHGATPSALYMPLLAVGVALAIAGLVGFLGYFSTLASVVFAGLGLLTVGYFLALRRSAKRMPFLVSSEVSAQLKAFGLQPPVSRGDFERVANTLRGAAKVARNLSIARVTRMENQQRLEVTSRSIIDFATQLGIHIESRDVADVLNDISLSYEHSRSARAALAQVSQESDRVSEEAATNDLQLDRTQRETTELLETKRCAGPEADRQFEQYILASRRQDEWRHSLESLSSQEMRFRQTLETFREIQTEREAEVATLDSFPRLIASAAGACHEANRVQSLAQSYRLRSEELALDIKSRDAQLERTRQELAKLYAKFSCADTETFHGALAQATRRRDLEGERLSLSAQLRELQASYPSIEQDLTTKTPQEDAQILSTFEDLLSDLKGRLDRNEAEEKEIYARLHAWDSSDRLGDLHANLKALVEERDQAVAKWAELALTRFLLEETRSVYEVEHAPKVLKRAGEFIKTITSGRYDAVVRNVEGDGYELIMRGGKRLPATIPQISRGVFAQVYLCIRLAYTDVMSSHRPIPYMLDDVLSDFDDERLERGLKVLSELGKERQIVLFTHHRRILDAAGKAGATPVSLGFPPS